MARMQPDSRNMDSLAGAVLLITLMESKLGGIQNPAFLKVAP